MSGSHKEFPKKAVFLQLGLAALVGIGFLAADKPAAVHAMAEKVTKPIVQAAAKVLAPIGKVEIKEEKVASARSGEEIYGATCGVCHDSGAAGAPKLDEVATWETRLEGGFAALVASAINGKGGMPAKGGNPDLSDSEMELVVGHMIKTAGIDLIARPSGTQKKTEIEAEPESTTETKIEESAKPEVTAETQTESTTETEATPEVKTEEAAKPEAVKLTEEAVEVATTAIVVETQEIVEEVKTDVAALTTQLASTVDEVKVAAEQKVEAVKTEVANTVTPVKEAVVDHSKGEEIYKNSCFACHDSGLAGSPKIGVAADWESRISKGNDKMYETAIKGKGAMPAKGGNMSISDADIKAAVDYMTSQSM